jgi:tRNA threonylcarbamoyl adenosine modification protein YeaZ
VLLLALDTATPAVTVALHDGGQVVSELTTVDARRQGELLAAAVKAVIAEAGATVRDITVIAAGVGPGPYTGLRAGLVTARVLGSSLSIPAHGVCSLDVIAAGVVAAGAVVAEGVVESGAVPAGGAMAAGGAVAAAGDAVLAGREFLVATDARRRELYWARYSPVGERLAGPAVATPASLPAGLPVAGEGAHLYPDLLGDPVEPRFPSAATLAAFAAGRLAAGEPLLPLEPLYLRRPDARVPGPPKPVTGGRGPAAHRPGQARARVVAP